MFPKLRGGFSPAYKTPTMSPVPLPLPTLLKVLRRNFTTTQTAMATPTNPFIFEDGSTRIAVTYRNNRIIGLVNSHAPALASPVCKYH